MKRFATLTQAISSTMAAAAKRIHSDRAAGPSISSRSGRTTAWWRSISRA
jgi:hypothetical protein